MFGAPSFPIEIDIAEMITSFFLSPNYRENKEIEEVYQQLEILPRNSRLYVDKACRPVQVTVIVRPDFPRAKVSKATQPFASLKEPKPSKPL